MRVNEIFYSLQGEGRYAGYAAVFVRFYGCNLKCPFCDTVQTGYTEMTEDEIVEAVGKYKAGMVVFTGGEPALQLTRSLVHKIHMLDKAVHVETNGTVPLPNNVDWVTLSPKDAFLGPEAVPVIKYVSEVKVLFDGVHRPCFYSRYDVHAPRFLQPLDTGNTRRNKTIIRKAVEYVKTYTAWHLSLQIHKILDIQ